MFRPSTQLAALLATVTLANLASPQSTELIGLASRGNGNLAVFVRGMDDAVWYKATTGTWFTDDRNGWTRWESFGGRTTSAPSATVVSGRLLVAVTGTDMALWSRWGDRTVLSVAGNNYTYDLTPWISGGGKITSSPSICGEERVGPFWAYATGLDYAIWRKKWHPNKWEAWQKVADWGTGFEGRPAVVCSSFGISTAKAGGVALSVGAVFAARSRQIWQLADPFGNDPMSLGAPPVGAVSGPAAAFNYLSGIAYVFVTGKDSAVWYRRGDSPTPVEDEWVGLPQADRKFKWSSSWVSLGGVVTSAPSATWTGRAGYSVAVAGKDGAVWVKETRNDGKNWTPWTSIGGQIPIPKGVYKRPAVARPRPRP